LLRRSVAGTLIGLLAAGLALLAGGTAFVQTIELKTYDVRVRATARPEAARRDILMVNIDEDSVRQLESQVGRYPWPRLVHAYLLNYLARAPARVVAYDILFTERDRASFTIEGERWTGEESDRALVDAAANVGRVVFAADATLEADRPTTWPPAMPAYRLDASIEERPNVQFPFDDLSRVARAIGHTFVSLDADGPLRRYVPFARVGDRFVPSLAVATALLASGIEPRDVRMDGDALCLGPRRMPLVAGSIASFYGRARHARRALVNYCGPVLSGGRTTYAEYPFYRLFYSEVQLLEGKAPIVDPAIFRDKIVVVGTTGAGLHDVFAVPFKGNMPGMQIHANVIDNILSSRFMEPAPSWVGVVAVVACGVAIGLTSAWFGPWVLAASVAACLAGLAWLSFALFGHGTWMRVVEPVSAIGLAAFAGVGYQYFVEGREKRRIKRVFSRLVAPDVYDHLVSDPSRARLGGDRREMTVLFSDIRGFTSVSERGQPEEIVRQLNEYFTLMVTVLFRHRGTLDKFVGDMVMALFGAPVEDPDHADHAVAAAIDMNRELASLNRRWSAEGRPRLDIGIGINTGEMVAGNIGSEQIMSYTVIGDAVNLGARLESLTKEYGTGIIISAATRAQLKGAYPMRPLGEVTVKGKTERVAIYGVGSDFAFCNPAGGHE
jgi:adenylate cyclase